MFLDDKTKVVRTYVLIMKINFSIILSFHMNLMVIFHSTIAGTILTVRIIFAGSHDEEQTAKSMAFADLRRRHYNRAGPGDRGGDPSDRQSGFRRVQNEWRTRHFPGGMALRFVIPQELQRHVDQR